MFCRNIYRYHGRTTDRLTGVLGARDTCVSKNSVTNNFINIVLIKFHLFLVSMAIWEMHCNGITEGHSFPLWALCLQQNPLCLQQRTHLCLEQNLQMKANITNKTLFSTPIIFFPILTFLSRTIQIPPIQEEPRFDNRWHVRPRVWAWRLCCRRLL